MSFLSKLFGGLGAKQGSSVENIYQPLEGDSRNAISSYLNRGANAGGNEVMQDPRLAAMFGQNWQNALGEEQNLASRGYSLQPEDYEAYGQAAGNIARQFGQQQEGLAQALASRGLSRSGGAANAIASSVGSKGEQLARLQTDIAQKRMQSNLNRLNETRNYLNQLTGQYQQATSAKDALAQSKAGVGSNTLASSQAQRNQQFNQQQATGDSGIGGALRRGVLGAVEAAPGAAMQGGLSAALGGIPMPTEKKKTNNFTLVDYNAPDSNRANT